MGEQLPISNEEFHEFEDDIWKNRVIAFLTEKKESATPAYDVPEIAQELAQLDSRLPDIRRKIEWALEDLVSEGTVIKTKIKINDYFYYMMR